MQRVKAIIHLDNIKENAKRFLSWTGTRLCAVVKADAYGHGAEAVTAALSGVADCFAVALIEEALAIRVAACGKEILVFTPPTTAEEGYMLAVNGFSASVDSLKTARLLCWVCQKYRVSIYVHLKVNTGMNRYGMNVQTLGKVCKLLQRSPYVKVRGIYSHLCECSLRRATAQRALFTKMAAVGKRYFPSLIAHLGATYGAMLGESYAFDMVRVGLGLYGYLPCGASEETGVSKEALDALRPQKGMAVYAKAVAERKYVFGGLGYGAEISGEKMDRLSVCRVGYADGFLRQRDNGMDGWGFHANNLCMDACIRFGEWKKGEWLPVLTDAEQTAKETGTIPYEVLCAATRRAELIYDEKSAFCGRGKSPHAKGEEGAVARVYEKQTDGKHQP